MNLSNPSPESWQVAVEDRLYSASFDEMIEWINEGALLPEDLVKHGSLRWLEARKVPILQEHFVRFEESRSVPPPEEIREIYTNFQVEEAPTLGDVKPFPRISRYYSDQNATEGKNGPAEIEQAANEGTDEKVCCRHPDSEPMYYCGACFNYFCKTCPKSFGTVKLCPDCGGLCGPYNGEINIHLTHGAINKPYKRVKANVEEPEAPVEKGLTLRDLLRAFYFPFRFPASFLAGTLLFSIFGIGISVFSTGDTQMYLVAALSLIFLITLQFGEFSKTLENLTQHNIHDSYMPHINRYSFIEDFIHPLFCGLAVYIVSFSLFIVVAGCTLGLVKYDVLSQLDLTETEIRKKNNELSTIIEKEKARQPNREQSETADNGSRLNIDELVDQSKTEQQNTIFGSNYLGDNADLTKMLSAYNRLSIYLQMPLCFSFILGILYFPIACAVAGSTRSISKTFNPILGWQTLRRCGFDYIKILSLLLAFALILIGSAAGVFLGFSWMQQPIWGIFTAIITGSIAAAYLWLVYSEFLGISVTKKLVNAGNRTGN